MVDLSTAQQKVEINKFVISTNDILAGFSKNGLPEKSHRQVEQKIQQLTIHLKSPDVEKRTRAIEEIGITLSLASKQVDQAGTAINKAPRKVFSKALTQDQIPDFLESYLKKMYAKARKDGALTYDQISKYLSQFAATAQHIVIAMPPLKRKQVITEFKVSTEGILANITRESDLSTNQIREFRIKLHGHIGKLDVEDVEERIQVVDQIGLILAEASDASDASKKKSDKTFDEEFYKKDCIPYGLDNSAKLISMDQFFAFPFGDRRGPSEKDWFNFHIRYLQMAVDKNRIEKPVFEKISSMLSQVPKKKYRKYFNIFPSEKFEETTFLAVYDLWQNKALEKLVVE